MRKKTSKEDHDYIISSMLAELTFRETAATARELYKLAYPNEPEPSAKAMAGLSKVLAKWCQFITAPNVWQLKLFYLKESQIKDFDFKPVEELYLLHNSEQVARQRLLTKQSQENYTIGQPLADFLNITPPWEINALKDYQAKRIALTKQYLTKKAILKPLTKDSTVDSPVSGSV